MSEKLKEALYTGRIFRYIVENIEQIISIISRKLVFRKHIQKESKVMFMTFDFTYTCNPAAIANEILKRNLPIELVWVVKNKKTKVPKGITKVKYRSAKMYQEMNTSKIWIDNALGFVWDYMPKQKDQIYINTWHGSLGIKKLSGSKTWLFRAKQCKDKTNFCISNSIFEENVYATTFWKAVPTLKFGHPRNDILFDKELNQIIREKVHKIFKIDIDTKICLYAPTFRDDLDLDFMNIDFSLMKKELESKFGGQWCVLVRLHFKNKKFSTILHFSREEGILDASMYPNMQELLVAIDFGCTDYSSWAYDYVLTRKPLVIYAPDIEKYSSGRGLYYPLTETPFPIATNISELSEQIQSFDIDKYQERCTIFLNKVGCYEDGHASQRTVDFIIEQLQLEISNNVQSNNYYNEEKTTAQ